MVVVGQMVMKIWSPVIMDFQEIWMREILSSSADLKFWWCVFVCGGQFVESAVFLATFS